MRSFHRTFLVAGRVALALLTGCSSGGTIAGPAVRGAIQQDAVRTETAGPSSLRRFLLPAIPTLGTRVALHQFINFAAMAKNKGDTIALSDDANNVVDLFTAAGRQVGQLTGFEGPLGMASDNKGDLYVADLRNQRVQVYAAGFASPPTTLPDPGQYPSGVDTFANGAYVAVVSNPSQSVSIFKGSTLQRRFTLRDIPASCAFDASGNLFVASDTYDQGSRYGANDANDGYSNRSIVYEIPNATSGGTTIERLTTKNRIGYAYGVQVTTTGQIAVEDYDDNAIYTYNPPSARSLGTPTQITPLGGGSNFWVSFAFTKNMTNLYAANDSNLTFEYAYPAGGQKISTIAIDGTAYGVAIIPTQYPRNDSQQIAGNVARGTYASAAAFVR